MISPPSDNAVPELQITRIAETTIAPILKRLPEYVAAKESGTSHGITPAEARSVMDWLVSNTIEQIELFHDRKTQSWKDFSAMKCAIASRQARPFLSRLSSGCASHFNMENYAGIPHAAIIMELPIATLQGGVQWKSYLLDPTFTQFAPPHEVGERLAGTPTGKALAHALYAHGYAELNEENAAQYVKAFQPSRYTDLAQKTMLANSHHSYLELLRLPAMAQDAPLKKPEVVQTKLR